MGNYCVDLACPECNEFYDSYCVGTEEEIGKEIKSHENEIHFCENCLTFFRYNSDEIVKVIFPYYGNFRGWFSFFNNIIKYITKDPDIKDFLERMARATYELGVDEHDYKIRVDKWNKDRKNLHRTCKSFK